MYLCLLTLVCVFDFVVIRYIPQDIIQSLFGNIDRARSLRYSHAFQREDVCITWRIRLTIFWKKGRLFEYYTMAARVMPHADQFWESKLLLMPFDCLHCIVAPIVPFQIPVFWSDSPRRWPGSWIVCGCPRSSGLQSLFSKCWSRWFGHNPISHFQGLQGYACVLNSN